MTIQTAVLIETLVELGILITLAFLLGSVTEIVKQEGPIHVSNVALVSDGKATKVGRKTEGGKSVRFAKTTGKNLD